MRFQILKIYFNLIMHRVARRGLLVAVLYPMLSFAEPEQKPGPVQWHSSMTLTDDKLRSNEGFLLVDSQVARVVSAWDLNKGPTITLKPPQGRHLQLVKLKSGKHAWINIELPYFNLPYRLSLADEKRWRFRITPGAINYIGTLFVGEARGTESVDVRLVNRAAEVLALLREHKPEVLESYPLIYSGHYPDDFLSLEQAAP